MSLFEKMWKFNHLQLLEQKEHLLLNYFKTLIKNLIIKTLGEIQRYNSPAVIIK